MNEIIKSNISIIFAWINRIISILFAIMAISFTVSGVAYGVPVFFTFILLTLIAIFVGMFYKNENDIKDEQVLLRGMKSWI